MSKRKKITMRIKASKRKKITMRIKISKWKKIVCLTFYTFYAFCACEITPNYLIYYTTHRLKVGTYFTIFRRVQQVFRAYSVINNYLLKCLKSSVYNCLSQLPYHNSI